MRRLWESMFGSPNPDLEKLSRAIRRRLEGGRALWYEAEYGMSLAELASFPGPWSAERDFEGGKMKWRATSPTTVEVCVTPAPIAPHIEVSIGFANPGEVLYKARAVRDAATCDVCALMDGLPIQRADAVPWASCTAENGCRCVAEPEVEGG
jgi:hypothetical protein